MMFLSGSEWDGVRRYVLTCAYRKVHPELI